MTSSICSFIGREMKTSCSSGAAMLQLYLVNGEESVGVGVILFYEGRRVAVCIVGRNWKKI